MKREANDIKTGMAFVADKVLTSKQQNFKEMVESYIQTDVNFREKLQEFTYGSKETAKNKRIAAEQKRKSS